MVAGQLPMVRLPAAGHPVDHTAAVLHIDLDHIGLAADVDRTGLAGRIDLGRIVVADRVADAVHTAAGLDLGHSLVQGARHTRPAVVRTGLVDRRSRLVVRIGHFDRSLGPAAGRSRLDRIQT